MPGLMSLRATLPHRLALLGHPNRAHATLADRFQQLVAAGDDGAGLLGAGRRHDGGGGVFQEISCPEMVGDELVELAPQLGIILAGLIQEGGAVFRRVDGDRLAEDRLWVFAIGGHSGFLPCTGL